MAKPEETGGIEIGGAATYRIVVRGALSAGWSHRLAGMAISDATLYGDAPTTVLEGKIRNPSELNGVLGTLSDLHLWVISVEQL